MRHILALGSVVLLASLTAQGLAPMLPPQDNQAVLQEEQRIDNAMLKGDWTTYASLIPSDWTIVNGFGQVRTRDQNLDDFKSGTLKVSSLNRSDQRIRFMGSTAVETGQFTATAKDQGKDVSGTYRYTNVWQWQNGRWTLSSSQLTKVGGTTGGR